MSDIKISWPRYGASLVIEEGERTMDEQFEFIEENISQLRRDIAEVIKSGEKGGS